MNHPPHNFKIGDLVRAKQTKIEKILGVVIDIKKHEEFKTDVLVIHWTEFGLEDNRETKSLLDRYRSFFHTLEPQLLSLYTDPPEEKKKKVLYTAQ